MAIGQLTMQQLHIILCTFRFYNCTHCATQLHGKICSGVWQTCSPPLHGKTTRVSTNLKKWNHKGVSKLLQPFQAIQWFANGLLAAGGLKSPTTHNLDVEQTLNNDHKLLLLHSVAVMSVHKSLTSSRSVITALRKTLKHKHSIPNITNSTLTLRSILSPWLVLFCTFQCTWAWLM